MTQQNPWWWLPAANGQNNAAPAPNSYYFSQQANQPPPAWLSQLGQGATSGLNGAFGQNGLLTHIFNQLAAGVSPQQMLQNQQSGRGWNSPLNTPTPTLGPPFQSQAPFSDYPGWNMQSSAAGAGSGQPGAAWNPGSAQGRPASWNVQQGMGPFGPNGASSPAPWQYRQYDPNNPGAVPQDYWNDPSFLTYTDYADAVAAQQRDAAQRAQQGQQWDQNFGEGQRQFNVGAGQWQQDFNANQNQQGIQNGQWDRTFAQQGSQWDRNFNANQAQQGVQNNQWDRNFNAQQGQQGWQNNFTQTEADRAADQWGQTFGANQAQNAWNNQYQTGRANAADSQWGQQFDRSGQQWNSEFARNQALDQWNQAFSQAGFDWQKQDTAEKNRLTDQGQNLAAFGRRFGPNVSYM